MGFSLSEKALLLGAFYPVRYPPPSCGSPICTAWRRLDLSGHQFSVAAADALAARGLSQGYLITQIPAGFLIQKYGGKIMLTINMIGTGVCTALLPAMLQSPKPVLLTWITLTISGENQRRNLL